MATPTGNRGEIFHPLYIPPLNEGCAEQESGITAEDLPLSLQKPCPPAPASVASSSS